jgi:hypothetical protein
LSSKTGKEVIFDAPIPTITGENPSRLSVVFDEVTIKERLLVEGGASNKVLSQFDGPVTFNNEIKINGTSTFTKPVIIKDTTSSPNKNTGALIIKGGIGIAENLNVGGTLGVTGSTTLTNATINGVRIGFGGKVIDTASGDLIISSATGSKVAINTNTTITGDLNVTGDITAFYTSDQRLKNNIKLIPNALDKVISISGNTFDWNEKSNKKGTEVGVIAQEILEVLPEVVTVRDNGYLAVNYEKLVPLLIEAIKELSDKVEKLEQK